MRKWTLGLALLAMTVSACKKTEEVAARAKDINILPASPSGYALGRGFNSVTRTPTAESCVRMAAPNTAQPEQVGLRLDEDKATLATASGSDSEQVLSASDNGQALSASELAEIGARAIDERSYSKLLSLASGVSGEQISLGDSTASDAMALTDPRGRCGQGPLGACIRVLYVDDARTRRQVATMGFTGGLTVGNFNLTGGRDTEQTATSDTREAQLVVYGYRVAAINPVTSPVFNQQTLGTIVSQNVNWRTDSTNRDQFKVNFARFCGDSYVQEVVRGRELKIVISLNTLSASNRAVLRNRFGLSGQAYGVTANTSGESSLDLNETLRREAGFAQVTVNGVASANIPTLASGSSPSIEAAFNAAVQFFNGISNPNAEMVLAAVVRPYYAGPNSPAISILNIGTPATLGTFGEAEAGALLNGTFPVGARIADAIDQALANEANLARLAQYPWHQWQGDVVDLYRQALTFNQTIGDFARTCTANPAAPVCRQEVPRAPSSLRPLPAPTGEISISVGSTMTPSQITCSAGYELLTDATLPRFRSYIRNRYLYNPQTALQDEGMAALCNMSEGELIYLGETFVTPDTRLAGRQESGPASIVLPWKTAMCRAAEFRLSSLSTEVRHGLNSARQVCVRIGPAPAAQ